MKETLPAVGEIRGTCTFIGGAGVIGTISRTCTSSAAEPGGRLRAHKPHTAELATARERRATHLLNNIIK